MHLPAAFRILYLPTELNRKLREGGERAGQLMAEAAKGITPEIAPEVTEEIVAEATEQAKEAPSRLRQTLRELEAKWERTSTQFFQAPKL